MKEIIREKIKELKKEMESNVYNTKDWNIPNNKYYCGWSNCWKKVKREEIIFYVENETINMFCKHCWPEYMKDYIIDKLKRETSETLYEVWKEEEKGK